MNGDHPIRDHHGRRLVAVILALGLAMLLQPGASIALGCGVCTVTTDAFRVSHPKSLEIAVATRRAIDQGILPPPPNVVRLHRPGRGLIAAQMPSATYLAEAWISKQKFEHTTLPIIVHFLFIDTHEVIAIDVHESVAALRAEPVDDADIVVVTTRQALRAVLDEQLHFWRARELSLLHVDENTANLSGLLPHSQPHVSRARP